MLPRKLSTSIAAGAAAIAVAIGAYTVGNASSSSNGASGTANAAPPAQSAQAPQVGQVPPNWRPGTGTIVTGAAVDKAKAVAVATYPGGPSTVC